VMMVVFVFVAVAVATHCSFSCRGSLVSTRTDELKPMRSWLLSQNGLFYG